MTRRQLLATTAGILVSVLCLVLAVRRVDPGRVVEALGAARLALVLPFVAALFLFYWCKTWRWRLLLAPMREVRTRALFPAVMVGYAANALVPMQLGELVRTFAVSRDLALRGMPVLATIALERVFDLLSVLALLALALALGAGLPPPVRVAGYWIAGFTGVLLAGFAVYVVWTDKVIALLGRILAPIPDRLRTAVLEQLRVGAIGLDALRRPRLLTAVAGASALQWAIMWLCSWLSLLAFGLELPLVAVLAVLAFTVIGVTIPTSPGYVGSIQLAYVLALTPFGVDAADAVAASVFYHVLAFSFVIVAGIIFARRMRLALTRAPDQAAESPRSPSPGLERH